MTSRPLKLPRVKIWFKALRLPFLTATFVPVVLGTAIAWYRTGLFNPVYFVVTLAAVSFAHLGTNLTNDYYDHRSGNDEANSKFSPFNGGSRVIQDGQIPARHILYAALVCFLAATVLGVYLLVATKRMAIVLFGLTGMLCGFFYTASPIRIGYHSLGELAVGFGFGPLTLMGAYWIQTFSFDVVAAMASVPVAILILLVLLINEFPDYEADRAVRKRTLVVLLGRPIAARVYLGLLLLTFAFIAVMAVAGVFPLFALVTFVTIPLAVRAVRVSSRHYGSYPDLLPANAATIALHFSIGILLSGAFVASALW
jgi:1,4-dihydroxy-2-naphthoate polyprenyltransferase